MKKIGIAAGLAALAIVAAVLSGAALANGTNGSTKPESAPKPSEPAAKVYICHATGSATNPYVLIHVSSHALPAHTGHQGGHDIVLGSTPGPCPQPPAQAAEVKPAEHTQVAPTATPPEQSNTAPATKANEPQDNDPAEASDQSESASDQGEASDNDVADASEQTADQNQSASDDDDNSASDQHAQSHDGNGDNHSGDNHNGDGQHESDQSSGD